jgi:hypothetical protein
MCHLEGLFGRGVIIDAVHKQAPCADERTLSRNVTEQALNALVMPSLEVMLRVVRGLCLDGYVVE